MWNLSTSFTGTAPRPSVEKVDRHLAGAGPSSANPPPSRRQTASYRKRSDPSGWNDRKPSIFQGKKCEDLIHKDGRLEILQKWKFVSPKIGICHMCQKTVKHQTVWHDTCIPNCMRISLRMGPTIVGEKVGDITGYNPAKLGFEPPEAPKYERQ